MVAKTGVVRNPYSGKSVPWALAKCLQNEADAAESIGLTVYSIGNADHLDNRPAGGHTPWRDGSPEGIVWAVDIMVDHQPAAYLAEFKAFVLDYCKSDVDTTWIRFFNLGGEQFNFAGVKRRNSSDIHFHLEVENGRQNAATALMAAWKLHKYPPEKPPVVVTRKADLSVILIRKNGAVYKTNGFDRCEHVPGPSSRQGYKDLVAAFGNPVDVSGDLKDFGFSEESK